MGAVGRHTKNYRPDIDGLRALAVLSVAGFHFFPGFLIPGGFVGVDIFFVISGFLISGIILDDLAENSFSFVNFYARRVRRLFPALVLVLIFTFAIGWLVLFPEEYKALGKHIAGGAGFISNILYWRESGYFDAEAATKPLLHLWSLGIEEQFYIFFPLLVFLVWKKGFREILFIAVLLVFSLTYNFHLESKEAAADFYSPLARVWELLIGAMLAALVRGNPDSFPRRAATKINSFLITLIYQKPPVSAAAPLNSIISAAGFALIAYALITFWNPPVWPGRLGLFPAIGAALILAAGMSSFWNRLLLGNRLAVAIGLISYPLYLWHWPIISYLRILSGGMPDRPTRIVAFFIALVLAGVTYWFVERPFRFGVGWKRAKTLSLGVMMLAAVMAGLYVYAHDGLAGRGIQSPEFQHYDLHTYREEKDACQAYTRVSNVRGKFPYTCRLSNMHGPVTVALIGDSHAGSAYAGMVRINSSLGLNSLLFGRAGSNGSFLVGVKAKMKSERSKRDELLSHYFKILNNPEIKYVFIIHGIHIVRRDMAYMQPTIDKLTKAGKKVFLVLDWPRLPRTGADYAERPYAKIFKPRTMELRKSLERETLYKRWQKDFDALRAMKNATIIETWDAFCPDDECQVFSEQGDLLYIDAHHLTLAGSEFLAEKVLAPYLKEIAAASQQQETRSKDL